MQPPYPPNQPGLGPVPFPSQGALGVAAGAAGQPGATPPPQPQRGPAQQRPPVVGAPPPGASAAIQAATETARQSAQNLANVRGRYDNAAVQYDNHVNMTSEVDPLVVNAVAATFNEAQAALAKAEEDWANANRNLASAYAAEPGNEAQAKLYAAQAELASAEASALKAKTPADLQRAQSEAQKAQNEAARIAGELQILMPAQAENLTAQAAEARSRIDSGLFRAQAERERAGTDVAQAQAGQIRAETTELLPANVRNILAQAGYTETQIKALEQSLSTPRQITQGLDSPNLAFQDPQTGQVSGQRNPAYVNANTQLLQNEYDTWETIQGMIERRQISPTEAQAYMDSIRAQRQAAIRGSTVFQEAQERNRYTEAAAGIGRDLINNRANNAASLANSLQQGLFGIAQTMTRPVDFSGIDPYAMAAYASQQMSGGPQMAQTAQQLIHGLNRVAPDGLPELPPGTVVVPYAQGQGQPMQQTQAAPPAPRQMPVTIPDKRFQRRF